MNGSYLWLEQPHPKAGTPPPNTPLRSNDPDAALKAKGQTAKS